MAAKLFTLVSTVSALEDTVVYVAHPDSLYSEIVTIQIANTDTGNHNVDLAFRKYSERGITSRTYWGDGRTVRDIFYSYDNNVIVKDAYIPSQAALSVLDGTIFLEPNDFITVKPTTSGSESKFIVHVTCRENYSDEATKDAAETVSLSEIHEKFKATTY